MYQALRRTAGIVTAALLVAAVLATPGTASAAPQTDPPGTGTADRRDNKPGLSNPLVLGKKPTGRNSTNTNITCYVYGGGPYLSGNSVVFSVFLDCVGGVPRSLAAGVDIYRYANSRPIPIQESFKTCAVASQTQLLCLTNPVPCFQAGSYYDGQAYLLATDELGVQHEAYFYVPPKWVGCLV
ncbi:hypothetical protein AWW66_12375 [Micromonospora rosaria]|uniref:Uncharacterized protein n=1 Tax=Micromonospora rosaria TaxID=47874 RepID=A0A136PU91_9ACTN|nr:hypothetical protein [Micromonospora rosaria]KXK61706.1 hypothetical protein AWW66_12375 [Micromonospora rosaria]